MESNFSVIIKLAAIATTSFVLSVYSFAQEPKGKEVQVIKVHSELVVHSTDIQTHTDGNPFVTYQFLSPAAEQIPDRPYCRLWIKKDVLDRIKSKSKTAFSLRLNPTSNLIIRETPIINANIVDASIQYKVNHSWVSELYCMNISKLEGTKDVFGVEFKESRAIMLDKKLPPRKPAKSMRRTVR